MKKNIIKSFMSLFLSAILLISGLGLTVHASIDGPPAVDSAQEGLSDSGGSLKGAGGSGLFSNGAQMELTSFYMAIHDSSNNILGKIDSTTSINNTTVDVDKISYVKIKYGFIFPKEENIPSGARYQFSLPQVEGKPEAFNFKANNQLIKDENGKVIGSFSIETIDGVKKLVLYFESGLAEDDIKASVEFSGQFDKTLFEIVNEVEVNVPFTDDYTFSATIDADLSNLDTEDKKEGVAYSKKEGDNPISDSEDPQYIDWTVIVNSERHTISGDVYFYDEFTFVDKNNENLNPNDFVEITSIEVNKIIRNHESVIIGREPIAIGSLNDLITIDNVTKTYSFEVFLDKKISETYEIKYTAKLKRPGEGSFKISNSAGLKSGVNGEVENPVKEDLTLTWSEELPKITKALKNYTEGDELFNWEIEYNLAKEDLGDTVTLVDVLNFGKIDLLTIEVFEINKVDAKGNYSETDLTKLSLDTDYTLSPPDGEDRHVTSFEITLLNANTKAYLIRLSSDVPFGIKDTVVNRIEEKENEEVFAQADQDINTIPETGKIGQQEKDEYGRPFIRWTITITTNNGGVDKVTLADIFDTDLLSFNPADPTLYSLWTYDDQHRRVPANNSIVVSDYYEDEEGNETGTGEKKSGFKLVITNVENKTYEFEYITYYTPLGMDSPYLANKAEIKFINGNGSGVGEETIIATLDGPVSDISKKGKYVIENGEEIIEWEIALNESKIDLDVGSTIKDTFVFTDDKGSYSKYYLIEGSIVLKKPEGIELVENTDYSVSYVGGSGIYTGFTITLNKKIDHKLILTYKTTVDNSLNLDHKNEVELTWRGGSKKDDYTVEARHPGITKNAVVKIDDKEYLANNIALNPEYGKKTIEWSILFNGDRHEFENVKVTDTINPTDSFGALKNTEIVVLKNKAEPGAPAKWVEAESSYYSVNLGTGTEPGKFTVSFASLEPVPHKIVYITTLSADAEVNDIVNNVVINYENEDNENNSDSETIKASTLAVKKKATNLNKETGIITWEIIANATAGNYLITLKDAVLEDIIPSDQKIVKEVGTFSIKKVTSNQNDPTNYDDITNSLWDEVTLNVGLDGFSINLPDGAFQYIITFQTEIQHYPSVTPEEIDELTKGFVDGQENERDEYLRSLFLGMSLEHYQDTYINKTKLTNKSKSALPEVKSAYGWIKYFKGDFKDLIDKDGKQNEETENIDWTISFNREELTIHNAEIVDTISDNHYFVLDEQKKLIIEIRDENGDIDPNLYTLTEPGEDGREFSIKFIEGLNPLNRKITVKYSTRLNAGEIGPNITVNNTIQLKGGVDGTEFYTEQFSSTAQQWIYGGGGSSRLLNFIGFKRSHNNTPLNGAKFSLQRYKYDKETPVGDVILLESKDIDLDGNLLTGAFNTGQIQAGFYKLTEVAAPSGYIVNPPIYFKIAYSDPKNEAEVIYDYIITLTGANWNDPLASDNSNISVQHGNQMTITNNYKPLAVELKAYKQLEDQKLTESELFFDFQLYQVVDDDEDLIKQVSNDENGQVVFSGNDPDGISALQFGKKGTYTFYIREANNDPRFAHNDTLYMVVVDVSESEGGEGGLKATVTYSYYHDSGIEGETPSWVELGEEELPVFNNYYSARIVLEAKKILAGRRLNKDEFRFQLTEWPAEGPESTEPKEVTNDADGLITFPEITFDKAGAHYFIIEELPGSAGGVVYDKNVIVVKVNVAKNEESGKLAATIAGYYRTTLNEDGVPVKIPSDYDFTPAGAELPTFTNRYTAAPNVAIIGARKVLEGKDLAADQFSFELLDGNGKVVETVKNKADGHINFAEITYYSAGEYNYTIREVKGTAAGITYDETVHKVTVRVTDGGNGQLYTDVIYKDDKIPTFTNTYKAAATSATLTAHKTLTGKTLTANQFSFELVDKDGKVLETVKNKADGSISFTALNFDTSGDYSYTIREIKGSEAGITYDKTVHQVTVKVTDDKEGKLQAKVVYANGKAPTFTNIFSKEDTGSQIPTEPDDESKPDLPHTGEGRSTSALGLALILAGLALGLFAWLQQRPRKNTAGRNRGSSV